MVNGRIKKSSVILVAIIALIILVSALCVLLFIKSMGKVSFETNDKEFFRQFVSLYENDDEYEFYSLDAYYLEDTRTFFYNAKYKSYSPIDDTWYEVDEVRYGSMGHFENSYCLSWDELYGFDEVDKEFKQAQKEGIHKTYTQDEINTLFEVAYQEQGKK